MTRAAFKYTFPISKAEQRDDGIFLTGYASGPEVDSENERMAPEAIERFSSQINDAPDGMKLTYRDAHAPDGVLRDLGDITRAWVTEKFHLGIEVKLDEANPASMFLYRNITEKGKQYGMSVAGHVVDFADEFVDSVGKTVRTYKNVVLDEISNTTRPAWYPSFGSVLAKSIDSASNDDAGDTTMGDTANDDLLDTTVVEDATKSGDTTGDTNTEDTTAKAGDSTSTDETVDKSKVSGKTGAKLLGLFAEMQTTLAELGLVEAPATNDDDSSSTSEEDTAEKTKGDASTEAVITKSDLDALAEDLKKANDRIAELEALPRTQLPGLVSDSTKKTEDEFAELLAKATPSERLRLALAAQTGGR